MAITKNCYTVSKTRPIGSYRRSTNKIISRDTLTIRSGYTNTINNRRIQPSTTLTTCRGRARSSSVTIHDILINRTHPRIFSTIEPSNFFLNSKTITRSHPRPSRDTTIIKEYRKHASETTTNRTSRNNLFCAIPLDSTQSSSIPRSIYGR